MKSILFIAAACLVVVTSCNKGKFTTQPQIEIKSYKSKVIGPGDDMNIRLHFTDKEGDLTDGEFIYIPKRLNIRPLPPIIPNYDSVKLVIPTFPDEKQGDFVLDLPWINLHKSDIENDSIIMRFVVIDKNNNKSDTVNSDVLVILKN